MDQFVQEGLQLRSCTFQVLINSPPSRKCLFFFAVCRLGSLISLRLCPLVADENRIRRGSRIRPGRGFQEAHAQAALSSARPGHLRLHRGPEREDGGGAQDQGQEPVT